MEIKMAGIDKHKKYAAMSFISLFLSASAYAVVNHTPTQLVDIACPTEWKNLDVVIDPNDLNWANSADSTAFEDYQEAYLMDVTKGWDSLDVRYADDALTVASECALRKNTVVDNYFNKIIDDITVLQARISIAPFIMGLLLD